MRILIMYCVHIISVISVYIRIARINPSINRLREINKFHIKNTIDKKNK